MTVFEDPPVATGSHRDSTASHRPDPSENSIGDLLGQVTKDLSTLMRQEVQLATAEIKQEVSKTGKAAGMLAGAGFAGYMVLLFATVAFWRGLATVMNDGWAALIVTAVWAVIAAVLAMTGRARLRAVHLKPERTVETLEQVPDALKGK